MAAFASQRMALEEDAMPAQTGIFQVHVRLLDEGTEVTRPTLAVELGDGRYRLLPTQDYDPRDEVWEFPPESIVLAERRQVEGEDILFATQLAA